MITFIPFEESHLSKLPLSDPGQIRWRHDLIARGDLDTIINPGRAWTGVENGIVVGCAGFLPIWAGRMLAWAVLVQPSQQAWHRIYRKIRQEIAALHSEGVRRIEATVPVGFGAGCRLASALGFKIEGQFRKYDAYGKDHFIYSHVTGDV